MSVTNEERDIFLLDFIQLHLEQEISNYAIDATEDIIDEENDETVRALWWSVGPCQTCMVIAPSGEIKAYKPLKTHKAVNRYDLLLQATNCIIQLLHTCYSEEVEAETTVKK